MRFPYTKGEVHRAGKQAALSAGIFDDAISLRIIEEWRAAHAEPLNQMRAFLDLIAEEYDDLVVAGRLKRTESIIGKLRRKGPEYSLKTMRDIAGCRLILPELSLLPVVLQRLEEHSGFKEEIDYIQSPKLDGYRCVHTFHRCDAPDFGLEKLRVEVQVRSRIQHSWSTAVEGYDLLSKTELKFGNAQKEEARFFLLASNLLASLESDECCFGASLRNQKHIIEELNALENRWHFLAKLEAYSKSVTPIFESTLHYEGNRIFVIRFELDSQMIFMHEFSLDDSDKANCLYSDFEQGVSGREVVLLIQSKSLDDLYLAYPNYFSDISFFIETMHGFLDPPTL